MQANPTPLTFEDVARAHDVTMTFEPTDANPFFSDVMHHYAITLWHHDHKPFKCVYSMGMAHTHGPAIGEVLECLTMDYQTMEGTTGFWNYCDALGITPSEREQQNYELARTQADQFFQFASGPFLRALLEVEA